MESPFPGMDPYLELPSRWPDVHNSLMYVIREQLEKRLSPRYTADITPFVTIERIEIAPTRRAVVPDIGVLDSGTADNGGTAVAIAPAPLKIAAVMELPTRYSRVEIRTLQNEVLVTAIELLSPANKCPGVEGADAHEKKRQELFRSDVHLLEIDLLRGGRRPRLTQPLPPYPYFIFLSRASERPYVDVWYFSLREPIAPVPVPLLHPDPDIALDLNAALRQIYASGGFSKKIDYRADPPPPELSADDSAWLDALLRERGLRG